ncbi:probable cytochrome P450 6a13 isoform X2 [Cimex lectularius]|nr:probable cytochrome P450 6a13 isoform X2 [Cimex lectularius]XP_024083478.1 probable cytochrome P450 6a13 isoform X2 [Cimex lectularius]
MIKHPDLIKEVFVDKFEFFNSNDIQVRRDTNPILKMNPLLSSGATWRALKSVLTPLTEVKTLEGMFTIVKATSQNMVEYIDNNNILPIECKQLSSRYILNVIASCALGLESNVFKDADNKFSEMSSKIFKYDSRSNIALLLALYAPSLAKLFTYRIIPPRVSNYFISLISEKCRYRVKESVHRNDFLQHLININKESEASGEGTVYNYDKITAHCLTILINGYFMTVSPFYYCLFEIASKENVQADLRKELKTNNINDQFSLESLNKLIYLDMVLNETLRLHSPIQVITRRCTKDTVLNHDGLDYKIKAGTPVTIPICAIHTDPKLYFNPNDFIPERFKKENEGFTYLPFGKGPRKCPGAQFAKLILKVALVSIMLKFRIELRDPFMELKQDPKCSLLKSAKGDVLLKFKLDPL